jgi:hypothetical protein
MTKDSFGESLKREREMRGVTLDEISAATRISTRFLQAIEGEQWDQLPGGVFNRGFVRAVARYLGLDEENIVAEYTLAVGDRQTVPVWTGSPPAVTPEQPWLAWIMACGAFESGAPQSEPRSKPPQTLLPQSTSIKPRMRWVRLPESPPYPRNPRPLQFRWLPSGSN